MVLSHRVSGEVSAQLGETGHFITHLSHFTRENTLVFWLYGQTRYSGLAVAPESWTCKGTLVGTNFSLESLKNQETGTAGSIPSWPPVSGGQALSWGHKSSEPCACSLRGDNY